MSSPVPPAHPPDDEPPNVPGLKSWRGVYLAVFVWFLVVVAFLAVFTRVFA